MPLTEFSFMPITDYPTGSAGSDPDDMGPTGPTDPTGPSPVDLMTQSMGEVASAGSGSIASSNDDSDSDSDSDSWSGSGSGPEEVGSESEESTISPSRSESESGSESDFESYVRFNRNIPMSAPALSTPPCRNFHNQPQIPMSCGTILREITSESPATVRVWAGTKLSYYATQFGEMSNGSIKTCVSMSFDLAPNTIVTIDNNRFVVPGNVREYRNNYRMRSVITALPSVIPAGTLVDTGVKIPIKLANDLPVELPTGSTIILTQNTRLIQLDANYDAGAEFRLSKDTVARIGVRNTRISMSDMFAGIGMGFIIGLSLAPTQCRHCDISEMSRWAAIIFTSISTVGSATYLLSKIQD